MESSRRPAYRLVWIIGAATLCRVFLNTARRFAYPFAPVLSRELEVPLSAVTAVIAVNQATGMLGLVIGPLGDRLGYRAMMLAGLGLLVLGMSAGGFFPAYATVFFAFLLAGAGKTLFDPTWQAFVGENVPYRRRGLAVGVGEFSWAFSSLLGIPAIGLLMEKAGWRSPFFVLGLAGLLGALALRVLLPGGEASRRKSSSFAGIWNAWRRLLRKRAAAGALGFAFFLCVANDNLFVVYGAWLEESFGLGMAGLGLSTIAIGAAELSGETLTAALGDRLGLKRSVIAGMIVTVAAYATLPLWKGSLPVTLVGLFVVFFVFEFTIVSFLSLATELVPEMRATMMSGYMVASSLGRVSGAFLGGTLWLWGGITATCAASAAISMLGLVILLLGLKGWPRRG
jgi:predicted MFS family arabinose efflux permease